MIPVIGLLLCVYLIFKGIEIYQQSVCSPVEPNKMGLVIGVLSLLASIVIATLFAAWIISQAAGVDDRLRIP